MALTEPHEHSGEPRVVRLPRESHEWHSRVNERRSHALPRAKVPGRKDHSAAAGPRFGEGLRGAFLEADRMRKHSLSVEIDRVPKVCPQGAKGPRDELPTRAGLEGSKDEAHVREGTSAGGHEDKMEEHAERAAERDEPAPGQGTERGQKTSGQPIKKRVLRRLTKGPRAAFADISILRST